MFYKKKQEWTETVRSIQIVHSDTAGENFISTLASNQRAVINLKITLPIAQFKDAYVHQVRLEFCPNNCTMSFDTVNVSHFHFVTSLCIAVVVRKNESVADCYSISAEG